MRKKPFLNHPPALPNLHANSPLPFQPNLRGNPQSKQKTHSKIHANSLRFTLRQHLPVISFHQNPPHAYPDSLHSRSIWFRDPTVRIEVFPIHCFPLDSFFKEFGVFDFLWWEWNSWVLLEVNELLLIFLRAFDIALYGCFFDFVWIFVLFA